MASKGTSTAVDIAVAIAPVSSRGACDVGDGTVSINELVVRSARR
jgi:hypothetical protein